MNNDKNISSIIGQKLCSCCGACFTVCRRSAISYTESVGGYIVPIVDESVCNNCGLCFKVCPGIHLGKTLKRQWPEDPFVGAIRDVFVGKSNDQEIYRNSQSGGIVTALLNHLLETEQIDTAVVTVMKSGTPPRGDVILAKNRAELIAAQKSKYTPIPVLKAVKEIISSDCRVAFVGLSCHMHGLYNLCDIYPSLGKKIIVKIGLICDRTLTAAAVDFLAHNSKDKVNNITFRDKNRPSYPGNVVLHSSNNREYLLDAGHRMKIKDFFTPARCTICFDKMNVFSDITAGDPHGIEGIDRIGGESLVITRTNTGSTVLIDAVEHNALTIRETDAKIALAGQKIRQKRTDWQNRASFWESFSSITPDYFPCVEKNHEQKSDTAAIVKNAFKLDTFKSRKELLFYYRRKLLFEYFRRLPSLIIRKVKNKLVTSKKF